MEETMNRSHKFPEEKKNSEESAGPECSYAERMPSKITYRFIFVKVLYFGLETFNYKDLRPLQPESQPSPSA